MADAISNAVEASDIEAAGELRNAIYDLLRPLLENVAVLEKVWNGRGATHRPPVLIPAPILFIHLYWLRRSGNA